VYSIPKCSIPSSAPLFFNSQQAVDRVLGFDDHLLFAALLARSGYARFPRHRPFPDAPAALTDGVFYASMFHALCKDYVPHDQCDHRDERRQRHARVDREQNDRRAVRFEHDDSVMPKRRPCKPTLKAIADRKFSIVLRITGLAVS
jgi:hypothetical protein